jgi:hypothetical protein
LAEPYAAKPPRLGQEFKVGSKLLADLEHVGVATSGAPSSNVFTLSCATTRAWKIMIRKRQTVVTPHSTLA